MILLRNCIVFVVVLLLEGCVNPYVPPTSGPSASLHVTIAGPLARHSSTLFLKLTGSQVNAECWRALRVIML
jgi:hypothetical protein